MTARQRLLDFLATRETASAVEAARALGCKPANARHHLGALLREGVVVLAASPPPLHPGKALRPGRPVQRYALAQPERQHNLGALAGTLLEALLARTPPEQHGALLHELAGSLAAAAPLSPGWEATGGRGASPRPSLTLRLANAVRRLNEMGYRARWEARAAGPRLILGHCPYAALTHPQLCELDAALLATLLGEPVVQQVRLETAASGLPYCLFQIEPKSAL